MPTNNSRHGFSFMSSIDWKRVPRGVNLSFGKRKKSAGAISGEYGACSKIFIEFLTRNSLTMIDLWDCLSEQVEQQRVSCPNNRLKWYELIREAEKVQRLISLKLKCRFLVTISFTLAMLSSVEDVNGRPERGKSCSTSRPLLNALYHSYACFFDKVNLP